MYYCKNCGKRIRLYQARFLRCDGDNHHKQCCVNCDSEDIVWSFDAKYIKLFYRQIKLRRIFGKDPKKKS